MSSPKKQLVPEASKRAYKKPVLSVYGDVREVTQTFAFGVGSVDMSGGIFKTQPMV